MNKKFRQISDSVWLFKSDWFNYNSGLIRNGQQCWLIDPGISPAETLTIKKHVESNGLTCSGIVLTHFHWDHILGAGTFASVPLITHKLFPVLQNEFKEKTLRAAQKWMEQSSVDLSAWTLMHRPATVIETRTRFHFNNLEVQLIPLPGHTADQVGVYLPGEKVLWAADMLSDLEIPYISSSGAAYLHSLQKLQQLEIDRIIPGHGSPTLNHSESAARLERDTDYLINLSSRVIKGVAENRSLQEIKDACAGLPIIHESDNREAHQWNIESVYLEAGGYSGGIKIGWEREWE